jgi:hypothetical protein
MPGRWRHRSFSHRQTHRSAPRLARRAKRQPAQLPDRSRKVAPHHPAIPKQPSNDPRSDPPDWCLPSQRKRTVLGPHPKSLAAKRNSPWIPANETITTRCPSRVRRRQAAVIDRPSVLRVLRLGEKIGNFFKTGHTPRVSAGEKSGQFWVRTASGKKPPENREKPQENANPLRGMSGVLDSGFDFQRISKFDSNQSIHHFPPEVPRLN